MFRKAWFWGTFALISLICLIWAVRNFSRAFPIVTLDLTMNREAALAQARNLAPRFQFPPDGYTQAASFGNDQEVQNFVELEAGGTAAFQRMMSEGLYQSFRWTVRHYKPGEAADRPNKAPFSNMGILPRVLRCV
jgi:hypothetical protein